MIRLNEILELLRGEVVCVADDERKRFPNSEVLKNAGTYDGFMVRSISSERGTTILELCRWRPPEADAGSAWAKEYRERNGSEPGFF